MEAGGAATSFLNPPNVPPLDPAHEFKGHPQPSPNERLESIKIFLADEDPDRCYDFLRRFKEIKEYIDHLKDKPTTYDARLYKEVCVMLDVHEKWLESRTNGAAECKPGEAVPSRKSTRLIDAATSMSIKQRRELLGTASQMRTDKPPFTIETGPEQTAFLDAMSKDAISEISDPEEREKNLITVESRAYSWALQDPAVIPVWMHPTKGIPNKGLTEADPPPWCRQLKPQTDLELSRPMRPWIPAYLLDREKEINRLLKNKFIDVKDFQRLEELLRFHEPLELRRLYRRYQDAEKIDPDYDLQATTDLKTEYWTAQKEWFNEFRLDGVFLMEMQAGPQSDQPGVFYVPGDDAVTDDLKLKTQDDNEVLAKSMGTLRQVRSYDELPASIQLTISKLLIEFAPVEIQGDFPDVKELTRDSYSGLVPLHWTRWVDSLSLLQGLKIRQLRPGEMRNDDPNELGRYWNHQDNAPPAKPVPQSVKNMGLTIQQLLDKQKSNTPPLSPNEELQLRDLLSHFFYPALRTLYQEMKDLQRRCMGQLKLNSDQKALDSATAKFNTAMEGWIKGLQSFPISILMPRKNTWEDPAFLYWRGEGLKGFGSPSEKWSYDKKLINHLLQNRSTMEDSEYIRQLGVKLIDYQYPHLRALYDEYKSMSDPEMAQKRNDLAQQWNELVKLWISSIESHPECRVKINIPIPRIDPDGDPSHLYFRDKPTSILGCAAVDPSKVLSPSDITKIIEMLDKAVAENADIGTLAASLVHENYLPVALKDLIMVSPQNCRPVSEWKSSFDDWCYRVRCNAGIDDSNISTSQKAAAADHSQLPNDLQRIQNEINKDLLEVEKLPDGPAKSQAKVALEKKIRPFWLRQYLYLQRKYTNRLRLKGHTDEEIKLHDMSLSNPFFRLPFDNFQDRCRRFGFKLTKTFGGYCSAEPVESQKVSGRRAWYHPVIFTIEDRLNELLKLERDSPKAGGSGVLRLRDSPEGVELWSILRHCLTPRLRKLKEEAETARTKNDPGELYWDNVCGDQTISPAETRSRYSYLIQTFSMEFLAWLNTLIQTGIRMRPPPRPRATDEPVNFLYWDAYEASGNNQGSQCENDSSSSSPTSRGSSGDGASFSGASSDIDEEVDGRSRYPTPEMSPKIYTRGLPTTPKVQTHTPSKISIHISRKYSDPIGPYNDIIEEILNYEGKMGTRTYSIPAQVPALEKHIQNHLIAKDAGQITPQEMSCLCEDLRIFMPEQLWRNYSRARELDHTSRTSTDTLTNQERHEFFRERSRMIEQFDDWTKDWTPDISIYQGAANEIPTPPDKNTLYLQVAAPQQRKRMIASTNMPTQIAETETKLNGLLSYKGPLNVDDRRYLQVLLEPLWLPRKIALRENIIRFISSPSQDLKRILTAEEEAIVEARLKLIYGAWRLLLIEYGQTSKVKFVEKAMKKWDIALEPGVNVFPSPTISIDHLQDTEKSFRTLAEKIRTSNTTQLSDFERKLVFDAVKPISLESLGQIEDESAQLVVDFFNKKKTGEDLTLQEIQKLQTLDSTYLWQTWGSKNEDLREEVCPGASVPDPLERLIGAREYTQQGQQPVAVLTRGERNKLEVEINNLLLRVNRGESTCGHEQRKLKYILHPLLGADLRELREQIERINRPLKRGEELDFEARLQLVELVSRYSTEFSAFLNSIPKHGTFLDTWWYKQEIINDVYNLSQQWDEALRIDPTSTHTGPCTSPEFENEDIADLHAHYRILKAYVHRGKTVDKQQEATLIFDAMPTPLQAMLSDLRGKGVETKLSPSPDTLELLPESIDLQRAKQAFVQAYVAWYSKLQKRDILQFQNVPVSIAPASINWEGKAERRGVQRAAIEIALNLLATNQEQHRTNDQFRIVELPDPPQPRLPEIRLSMPLEPDKRPVEQHPFKFSRAISTYTQWKDFDYGLGRTVAMNLDPVSVPPPENYTGPFVGANGNDVTEAARYRQNVLNNYYSYLAAADRQSPRPLLQLMLTNATSALTTDEEIPEIVPLSQNDLDLLEEVCAEPWDEQAEDYTADILDGDDTPQGEQAKLREFERDVRRKLSEIPLWRHPQSLLSLTADGNDDIDFGNPQSVNEACKPFTYDPTVRNEEGVPFRDLIQSIRNSRLLDYDKSYMWTNEEAMRYLRLMHAFGRIHFDDQEGEEPRVSRVPLTGHPENKYITSARDAINAPGVHFVTDQLAGSPPISYEVRYNKEGKMGPPIFQPLRNIHLMELATRLGYEIRRCMNRREKDEWTAADCLQQQVTGMDEAMKATALITQDEREKFEEVEGKPPAVTLNDLALELDEWAPDIADENGLDLTRETFPVDGTDEEKAEWEKEHEQQVAAALQIQILEEANNNWELQYPENEHVWDFAEDRLEPTIRVINGHEVHGPPEIKKFFSINRWPLDCQPKHVQEKIAESGPIVQTKPAPAEIVEDPEEDVLTDTINVPPPPMVKNVRHISNGGAPEFPFGETTFQNAFRDYSISKSLADVPEFQTPKRRRLWHSDPAEKYVDTHKLPDLPKGWTPDNITRTEKRLALIDFAKNTPGFPDPKILEYYHTPEEIKYIKLQHQWEQAQRDAQAVNVANEAIEKSIGKKFDDLTLQEVVDARTKLNIDQNTGKFKNAQTAKAKIGPLSKALNLFRKGTRGSPSTSTSPDGPAKNTRSKSPKKKRASEGPLRDNRPRKKTKK